MITPSIKDKVLFKLVEGDTLKKEFDIYPLSEELGMTPEVLDAILKHFEELGLCRVRWYMGGNFHVMLNVKAHDMALHGGFVAQEKQLRDGLEKLQLELDSLRPSFPDRAAQITGIIADISTVLGLFWPFK